jgi:hypothetical protein
LWSYDGTNVDQVDLAATGNTDEIENEDGPVVLLPVICAPQLHNLLARNNEQVSSPDLAGEGR